MFYRPLAFCAGALLLATSFSANAALITFTDRTLFQAAVSGALAFEGFEDDFATTSSQTFPVGGPTQFTVSALVDIRSLEDPPFTSIVSEGTRALSPREADTITFSFVNDLLAVGFDVNELNGSGIDYADSDGNVIANAIPLNPGTSFFGVISDTAFSSFSLTTSGNQFSLYGIDALEFSTVATPAPESATLSLLVLGLVASSFVRRTRSTRGYHASRQTRSSAAARSIRATGIC